jgi:hypothetical protein
VTDTAGAGNEPTSKPKQQIIVAEEKHQTRYLDASTPEAWAKSSLALLTQRFQEGYWYDNPTEAQDEFTLKARHEREGLLAVSEATMSGLPSGEQEEMRKKIESAKREILDEAEDARQYMVIKAVVEGQDLTWVGKRYPRPRAWNLLEARSHHQYEHVELEYVEVPGEHEIDI